jgi:hypothetical protein
MAGLSDFNAPTQKPKLADFFATGPKAKPVLSPASVTNVASYAASLTDPAQMESVYNKVTQDLQYGISDTLNRAMKAWDGSNQEADYATLTDIVADPSLTPEQRENAIRAFNAPGSNRIATTFFERTALAASMANSEPDDNDETDFVRVDTTSVINKVDEYNGWVQKQINQVDRLSNPDLLTQSKNVVELFIPFLEGSIAAQVSGELFGEDGETNVGSVAQALTLMGDNKAAVRDAIIAMPIDQRKEMAQGVIDLVLNSSGPTAFTENDIVMMNNLQSFLTVGGYNDTDKFIDNLFSVLDATLLVTTPLSKTIKGVTRLGKGVMKGTTDAATVERYKKAVEALETPEAVGAVDEVVAEAVGPSLTDRVIGEIEALDNVDSETIAKTREALAALEGTDDVSVEAILGNMEFLDELPADDIQKVRDVVARAAGERNKELELMVNDQTIAATKELVGNKLIDILEGLDDAPFEVYSEIRKVVDDKINATTIGSKTIGVDIVRDVNAVLTKKGLTPLTGKEAGRAKASITTNLKESVIRRRYVRSSVQPTSLSQAYVATNPAKARAAHKMMVDDVSGNAANILYGTNKTEAVGNDVLGEAANLDGSVRNKVAFDEASPTPAKDVVDDLTGARGRIEYTDAEKASMRLQAHNVWRDVQGLYPRKEMSTIEDTPAGVKFDVVYGPKDGGFSNPVQALVQAKYGLRKYGIDDDQIEILKMNETGNYAPTDDYSKLGNYLIRVKHDYQFSPADTVSWTLLSSDPLWRMFDVLPMTAGKAGGWSQHVIPSTAVIPKQLLDAASTSADRAAWLSNRLLALGGEYAKKFKKLDDTQKRIVEDYILRANAKGLKFNSVNLKAIGMTDEAVETVRTWKTVQDTLWHFENIDVNKTLRARGYMKYTDTINQTGDVHKVFDGNTVRTISREEIKRLYEKGGTIATTRSPVTIGDDTFEYALVDNSGSGSYLRAIRDDEPTLTYRDGYYSVRYDAPYFITKQVKGKDGKLYNTAIATAQDRKMADAELARLRTTDVENADLYGLRGDLKRGTDSFNDAEWQAMVSNGRTAQRVRGERLRNVADTETDLNKLHIESPEESLVNSIRSLSNRVAHRDFVTVSKDRWLHQFKHLVDWDSGIPKWPNDVRVIGANNAEATRVDIQDARTMWRYIEAIDSGYVNFIDDLSKKFFKDFSDTAGRSKTWRWLEAPTRTASKFGPTGFARKKAFRLLLAANPLRQLPVQAMQALPVVLATNPLAIPRIASQFVMVNYIQRGGDVDSFFKAIARNAMGLTKDEAKDLVKNYELSGFEAAVDANTFIRDDMRSLVDKGALQKANTLLSKPLDITQKYGFELGENTLMRTVWLSEYDKLRRAKKGAKIGADDVERVNAKVRHLTLNMNKAGELPYNENALSAAMQFFQAPHKSFAQILMGHKGLTGMERAKLGTAYVLAFGLGGGPVTSLLSNLIPDAKGDNLALEVLEGGFFNILMNKALASIYSAATGKEENSNTDFSDSFRLLEVPDLYQFFTNIVGLQVGEMLTASPSASLVFGDNARLTRFVKQLARPFTVNNERKGEELLLAGKEFLNIFSGMSNFFKAQYILEHQKIIGSSGQTIDFEATYMEGLMKAGGFATIDEVRHYALNDKTYKASQAYKDDIDKLITETSRRLASQSIANDEAEYWVEMMGEAQRVYQNEPFYLEEFIDQLNRRAARGEYDLFKTLMNLSKWVDSAKMDEFLRSAPSHLTEEDKVAIRNATKIMNESE